MEAPEVPTEHLHEHLEHAAEHGAPWIGLVAVSTAIIAALAAIASLLAGEHVNEAMVSQMKASDTWNEFGAKSIKGDLAETRADLLKELGKPEAAAPVFAKVKDYDGKKEALKEKAKELEEESHHHLLTHEQLARAVTMFQIAIAIAAISALTRRKPFWYVSLVFGAVGTVFLVLSLFPFAAAHP